MFELLEGIFSVLGLMGELNNPNEIRRKNARIGCILLGGFLIFATCIFVTTQLRN